MHIVDYFVIAGYFALVMYLGYYSMKKVSNFDDYAVAGRSMPLPIFFAAIAATLCGGGATIGRISFMHTTGIIVFFALTGVVINQIFSGLFISGRVHNAGKNVYSLGDLYGIYYGRSGRLLSSVFGFLFCVGAFGVQILAMGAILQTSTGISLIPAALIASIVTLAYTWSGGILAVTLTDAVQYVIIVIGVTLCAYLAIDHLGGFDAMMSILYSNPRFETNMKPLANWSLVRLLLIRGCFPGGFNLSNTMFILAAARINIVLLRLNPPGKHLCISNSLTRDQLARGFMFVSKRGLE